MESKTPPPSYRLPAVLCFLLGFGHLFDLGVGLDLHRSFAWFAKLTATYGAWDPLYIAQPFYMKIISLLSGALMMPMALAMGVGFLKRASWLKTLVIFYTGFITSSNIIWTWNEALAPVTPGSWAWAIGLSLPWWILPFWFTWLVHRPAQPPIA
ncbi:MAG: hypothetical protein KC609_06005 [Myxococcales bacterium]|nr:hypothetical protein [Myxococcales bacterium]